MQLIQTLFEEIDANGAHCENCYYNRREECQAQWANECPGVEAELKKALRIIQCPNPTPVLTAAPTTSNVSPAVSSGSA